MQELENSSLTENDFRNCKYSATSKNIVHRAISRVLGFSRYFRVECSS